MLWLADFEIFCVAEEAFFKKGLECFTRPTLRRVKVVIAAPLDKHRLSLKWQASGALYGIPLMR